MMRNVWLVVLLALAVVVAGGTAGQIQAAPPQGEKAAADGKVNINAASKTELMKLEGVGPALAEKIIEYREANGPFKKPEEIRRVRGFGKGLWEKNQDAITIE